ncbi:uncharacterized protein G2W53_001666 [Senna tora]|uniref:Uncharacterized protein n=1 Tax=Senna tora TaxID=362788 RepID=A0A834XJ39_9FABA|nr:uncharacterized protein G2W53_001666 [Senna tora]
MAGNNRQRKSSSSSFFSAFNIFKSKNRGGSHYDAAYDDGTRARKVWRSDEDNGHYGGALPDIDTRAEMFIRQYKRRVSESELFQLDPAVVFESLAHCISHSRSSLRFCRSVDSSLFLVKGFYLKRRCCDLNLCPVTLLIHVIVFSGKVSLGVTFRVQVRILHLSMLLLSFLLRHTPHSV